jgi:hypothetical protein
MTFRPKTKLRRISATNSFGSTDASSHRQAADRRTSARWNGRSASALLFKHLLSMRAVGVHGANSNSRGVVSRLNAP